MKARMENRWGFAAVGAVLPLAWLWACGSGGSGGKTPSEDAMSSSDTGPSQLDSTTGTEAASTAGEGGLPDAPTQDAATPAYDGAACVRAADPGWPPPFDAGALPDAIGLPQVLNSNVNPVLHNPTFISVTAPDDPYAAELEDFLSVLGCSTYWNEVVKDYGVGPGVAGKPVRLTAPPPSSQIGSWLAGKIDNDDPQFPRPAPETVYVLWYPAGASAEGFDCGSGFFHSYTQLMDGTSIWFAVATRCVDDAGATNDVEALTANSSHEIVEVSTDPGNGAYAATDPGHAASALLVGTEVADLCVLQPSAYVMPAGFPWMIQRVWSNRAAWAGDDPCIPVATPDYFYAAPILTSTASIPVNGSPVSASAATVAPGTSATIDVRLVSNVAAGGPLQVTAWDEQTGGNSHLEFTWEGADGGVTMGNAGDTLRLTITKTSGEPNYHAEVFGLFVTMAGSDKQGQTFGLTGD
jgi:hypothetical protein